MLVIIDYALDHKNKLIFHKNNSAQIPLHAIYFYKQSHKFVNNYTTYS